MNFDDLYRQYHKMVYNLALHYVQRTEDAEEICQDVFVTIYEKQHTFREEAELSTWIYRIAINKSLDHLKAGKRQKRFAVITSLFTGSAQDKPMEIPVFNHPGIQLEQAEQLKLLFEAINQLPENQKTVIILLKIEQKSQAETAEIMRLGQKAVESLFQRAKANLKKILEASEGK